jgi:hypothetical protein
MIQNMQHLFIFGGVCAVAFLLVTYLWPRLLFIVYKRAILNKGGGDGPIPINTLYTESQAIFVDPIHPPSSASRLFTTGVNRDTLVTVGWLDISNGPQILHVPEMAGRYYSVQFTDPSKNINFAYVGKRTTGTKAGDYIITGPGWKGKVPNEMKRISSPKNSVLVLGRVFVKNNDDIPTAYNLTKQIKLSPLK